MTIGSYSMRAVTIHHTLDQSPGTTHLYRGTLVPHASNGARRAFGIFWGGTIAVTSHGVLLRFGGCQFDDL